MSRLVEYIQAELLETIQIRQLKGEELPDLNSTVIYHLADSIAFEWKEVGDRCDDIQRYIDAVLNQYIARWKKS